jgi:hypothetical protein
VDHVYEVLQAVRLLEKVSSAVEEGFFAEQVTAVAAHEDRLQVGPISLQLLDQLVAV